MSRLRRLLVAGKIFFVTCNLRRTRTPFGDPDYEALAEALRRVRERRHFLLGGYAFMPDHWHALILPAPSDMLPKLMDAIKVAARNRINRSRSTRGSLWQPRYYDSFMRTVKQYRDTIEYMHLNPVRKGLVARPEDWPWSSIHSFGGLGPVKLEVDCLGCRPMRTRTCSTAFAFQRCGS